jgi:hypothetical protein
MSPLNNPSLRQFPRHEAADVIPLSQETSILDWLRSNGRLIPRDDDERDYSDEEEEISELMGADDGGFDDDDVDDADDMD